MNKMIIKVHLNKFILQMPFKVGKHRLGTMDLFKFSIRLFIFSFLLSSQLGASALLVSKHKNAHCFNPLWSPSAERIVYEKVDYQTKEIELYIVYILQSFKREKVKIPGLSSSKSMLSRLGMKSGEVSLDFSWSPRNLNMFVISTNLIDNNFNLILSNGTVLTRHKSHDGSPAWSHGGKKMIFVSGRSGEGDLYLKNILDLSTPAKRLTYSKKASELYPYFHPKGKKVLFLRHSLKGDHIYELDVNSLKTKLIVKRNGSQSNPVYSPDGKQVAFYGSKKEKNGFDLYIVKNGKAKAIVKGVIKSDKKGPTFTPDGKHIIYVKKNHKLFDPIQVYSLKTGRIITIPTQTFHNEDVDIVVDGQKQSWISFVAQGLRTDKIKRYKKVYIYEIPNDL